MFASAVFIAAATSFATAQGDFSLSTTALVGPTETGFDSGLRSVGRLDAAYAAKPGEPGNPRSFPFSWANLPQGTAALALVLDDPDARLVLAAYGMKGDAFLHWIAADIDPYLGGLGDNASASASFPQGKNGSGSIGYLGPQPPVDIPKDVSVARVHVYRLKLFALSAQTGLQNGFSLDELLAAVKDKTIGTAELDLSYSNQ
jgi:Raf kinase inhibitor-like YbhB/YbcL family protein